MACRSPGKWTRGKPAAFWKSHISSRRMRAHTNVWLRIRGEWTQWKESSLSMVGDPDVHEYLTSVRHICQTSSDWDASTSRHKHPHKVPGISRGSGAYTRREALFNATSKWLKAVGHDASNILIQIKGGYGWCGWALECDLVGEPRTGWRQMLSWLTFKLTRDQTLFNVLYIEEWHICQGHNLHSRNRIHEEGFKDRHWILLQQSAFYQQYSHF